MNQMEQTYPFPLLPLPYGYNALEPYISEETLHFHHDKHLKTYVDNLNKVLKDHPEYQAWTLESLIVYDYLLPPEIQTAIKNNAGGVYNHNMYFKNMKPKDADSIITPEYLDHPSYGADIMSFFYQFKKAFGSYDNFKKKMKEAGMNQFGSGYAWLVMNRKRELSILSTANQDNPLAFGLIPLLTVDVWEHAYYLDYQNRRGDYLDAWLELINWDDVQQNWGRY